MNLMFTSLLNMSITASFMIIAVMLFRLIFKRVPKWIYGIMWAMVAIRLVIPFSFESKLSLAPNTQKVNSTIHTATTYVSTKAPTAQGVNPLNIIAVIWVIGMALMGVYMLVSYFKLHKKVRESIKENDIYYCDHIDSPFVLGFIKPKIYLNSDMLSNDNTYVIAHEKTHIKRLDYIWKPLGFIILCIHWFNPLCWIAYMLFNIDIELACDEKVIKTLDAKGKKEYSFALLACSAPRRMISACPIAFGEASVKQRIKSVLSYKKPTVYIITTAIVACVLIAVLFMTSPVSAKTQPVTIPTVPVTIPTTEPTEVPTTVPATEVPTTEPATEPVTEAPTEEVTEEVTEEYYDDSYYEEEYYEDDYYQEEYYEENESEENDIKVIDIGSPEFDYYNSREAREQREFVSSLNRSNSSNWGLSVPQPNPYPNPLDEPIAWDPLTERNQFR